MQATGADQETLARDMYALAAYMMRSANAATFEVLGELDLSFTQIKTLCALEDDPDGSPVARERSVKGLADSLGISLAAMSRAVDGLFERGLVSREEDPSDRRMKRVRLTAAGHEVPRALNDGRLSALHELVSSLEEEQADALGRALSLIVAGHPEIAAYRPAEKGPSR
ncbi:MAG: MarR family winged helix-turn-helix transcriptional regulator [Solirubrobacteraceae bacterium]